MDDYNASPEMEQYHNVVSQTFASEIEAYKFYNSHAEVKGFSVRLDKTEYIPGTDVLKKRRFLCFREGNHLQKHFEKTDHKREPRPLSRCHCPAMLEIQLSPDTGRWFVKNFVDGHNHPLADPGETGYLRSHHRISDAQKADIVEYGVGGLRPFQIMEVMANNHGGFGKVGFIPRDLRNFIAKHKKKRISGRDAEFLLNHMRAQVQRDAEFFFKYSTDDEGWLKNIFWADSQSRLDYDAFGAIMVFDSTYRVNRYNLPFVPFIEVNHHRSTVIFGCGIVSDETDQTFKWLLHAFLEAMGQNHPKSIITDGDAAMRKDIKMVMPRTDHRLCSWHIEQNMVKHLRGPMLIDFRTLIYHRMGVARFENSWKEFLAKYEIKEEKPWLSQMYKLRKRWSAAYTNGRYFLGMRSNKRSESLNSRLHKHLDRKMSLVDLLEHYEHCVSRIHRNEAELDAKASQSVPFTKISAHPLEKSAARIYTPKMFKMVRYCIEKSSSLKIQHVMKEGGLIKYLVAPEDKTNEFVVQCISDGSLMDSVTYRCRKMHCEDIPCSHIFAVFRYLGLDTIPQCCVMIRWTMQAKAAFESERTANTHVYSEQMERYWQLCSKASDALFKGSKSVDHSQKVMDLMQSIIGEPMEDDENTEATTFGPIPAHFSGACGSSSTRVFDPVPVVTKGNLGGKRIKPITETVREPKRRRSCSQCGASTHDRRTCPQ